MLEGNHDKLLLVILDPSMEYVISWGLATPKEIAYSEASQYIQASQYIPPSFGLLALLYRGGR